MPLNLRMNVLSLCVTCPNLRGQGIGRRLFDYARGLLGDQGGMAVDCPVQSIQMFTRWGFKPCPVEYIDIDLSMMQAMRLEDVSLPNDHADILKVNNRGEVQDLASYDCDVIRYMDRTDFFLRYICPFVATARIQAHVAYRFGRTCGYAVLKKLPGRQFFLAPVFADDVGIMRSLVLSSMRSVSAECDEVIMRVPTFNADKVIDALQDLVGDPNPDAYRTVTWCRMFHSEEVILDWEKIMSVGINPFAVG